MAKKKPVNKKPKPIDPGKLTGYPKVGGCPLSRTVGGGKRASGN